MKVAIVLVALALIVAVSAQGKKKTPTNTQKQQFDKAKKGLRNTQDRDVSNELRGQMGSRLQNVGNDDLDKIVGDTKKVLKGAKGYMDTKDIAGKVRKDLGLSTSQIDDETLKDLVDREEKIGDKQFDEEQAQQKAAEAEQKAINDYNNSQG